ncbi:MAG: HD domain-containing protein [Planctomycetota bacterium]|nr:MAG: HD domain-containing protein [Planctomycetota bacterium]
MSRRLITELPPQCQLDQTFLATHKQLRPNRNGQLYIQVELADKSGTITGRLWNASDDDFGGFEDGDYVRVEGHTQLYSGSLQLIIASIERADPRTIDEAEFLVLSKHDLVRLEAELNAILATITSAPLKALADELLADGPLMEAFRRTPAGVKHHHAYAGGLLDHVVNLLRLADRVAPLYPALDRNLLLVGVLVHDIGKTQELESLQGFSYTDVGQLLGHVLLGLEIVDAKIRAIETRTGQRFEPEAAMRVKHMIASHHGQYEFGSPKLPMTLEAMALHHLDHLDAKMAGTIQLLQNEATAEDGWTQYQQSQGRKFYRGRG